MSTHYTNITLYGVDQDEIVTWCEDNAITAYVSPTRDDITVLYENTLAENANQDKPLEALLARGAKLSVDLMAPALVSVVMNDDMFMYVLYVDGAMRDNFMSYAEKPPVNGKPDVLCTIFDIDDHDDILRVRAALKRQSLSATERHTELMDALNLPPMMIDMGFEYLEEGEKPHDVEDNNDVVFIGVDNDEDDAPNDDDSV